MKISIITVSFNSQSTVEDTILSVLSQDYPKLEYIIVDGGSTDGTIEIINKYKDKISKFISEPDKGIYDAMNKGIRIASGEIIGIINSDDFYCNNHVLSEVVDCFLKSNVDACYGDLLYINQKDKTKIVRKWKAGDFAKKKIKNGWIMPHPTFFAKKEVYEKYGFFNIDFKIAADYELMLRFLGKGILLVYLKKDLVFMREGGTSAKNLKQRVEGWRELLRAWQVNDLKPPRLFIVRRIVGKLRQYF